MTACSPVHSFKLDILASVSARVLVFSPMAGQSQPGVGGNRVRVLANSTVGKECSFLSRTVQFGHLWAI